jgi:hypothetical protein
MSKARARAEIRHGRSKPNVRPKRRRAMKVKGRAATTVKGRAAKVKGRAATTVEGRAAKRAGAKSAPTTTKRSTGQTRTRSSKRQSKHSSRAG